MDKLDLSQTYHDIALPGTAVCLVEASANEVKCQQEKREPQSPKKTNDDLTSELINKVSVGMGTICGLHPDKTVFCWQGKGFQPDVPKNIKAE